MTWVYLEEDVMPKPHAQLKWFSKGTSSIIEGVSSSQKSSKSTKISKTFVIAAQ